MGESRYRLDDLRRFGGALLTAAGLAPVRASALAAHLLFYDAAAHRAFGLAALAGWLERIEARAVDPGAEGHVTSEMTGTAVFDGQNGIAPLVLARAADLAAEKARESGIGLVRVTHLGPAGPIAALAADVAIGPYLGALVGHDGTWALALPSGEGLPVVCDSTLAGGAPASLPDRCLPWASATVPERGWLVLALAVAALEPLATYHERVAEWLRTEPEPSGALLPGPWEQCRRHAREHGVHVEGAVWEGLEPWAERYRVAIPAPLPTTIASS